MRKLYAGILGMMLLAAGCSNRPGQMQGELQQDFVPGNYVTEDSSAEETTSGYVLQAKIVSQTAGVYFLIPQEAGEADSGVYTIGASGIPVINKDGNPIESTELKVGMLLNITYDGMILESYPMQLGVIERIQVTGEEDCLIPMYMALFKELYETDTALNAERYIAVDLTRADNLTEAEKEALIYLMGNQYEENVFASTYEKLCEEGYVDKENLYFPEGILFSVTTEEITEKSFTFEVSKWRGGLGAVGYSNCKAIKNEKEGVWEYTLTHMWMA